MTPNSAQPTQAATGQGRFVFNRRSLRVKEARLARLLKGRRWLIVFVIKSLVAAGAVWLVIQEIQIGWLVLAPVLLVDMILLWNRWYLQELPSLELKQLTGPVALERVLEGEILPLAAKANSPRGLWQLLRPNWQWRFLVVRLGIDPSLVESHLSERPEDLEPVWQTAVSFGQALGLSGVTGGVLTASLISLIPDAQNFLAQAKLSPEDLASAVAWQQRLDTMIKKLKDRPVFGGLARDWGFGYTPLLNRFGQNISREVESGGFSHLNVQIHEQVVTQMMNMLVQPTKNSVSLVGETGVGKTTLVYALAERLLSGQTPKELAYAEVFSLNASVLISNAQGRGELENLLLHLLSEAAHAKNVILFLDDAHLFLSEGTGSVNLANVLLPILQHGAVRIILAMAPNDWQKLVAEASEVTANLGYLAVPEADQTATIAVLQDQAFGIEAQTKTTITYQAIREAYVLAERYVTEQVFPGRAIGLLESAANFAQAGLVTAQSVAQAVESTTGAKVAEAKPAEKSQLLHLEEQLHQRMVNQDYAVKVVADALRRARAGVKAHNRPVGSFLFLGPTGVGKTELSKALADAYFGPSTPGSGSRSGREQMVRLDMTEYVNANDVDRMLAPSSESGTATTFLTQIRNQPFSVVLLDEVEKSHPDILNLLLQLLDEGQLTDTAGRPASFKDAIIIATSNAGADAIRAQIEAGKSLEQFSGQFVDDLINRKAFLPELINRFDEVVLFRPLKPEELKQIVGLMIDEVNQTLEQQKVAVSLSEAATNWLVEHGNDPRLGARPLRRMIQRSVENVVAKRLLAGQAQAGSQIQLDVNDLESSQTGQRQAA